MPTWAGPKAFTEFAIDLQRMSKDLTVDERQEITRIMGREAEKATRGAVVRSLGAKRGFSGWRRGKTVPLNTRLIDGRKGATIMAPTKPSAGVATTAQYGRNQGNARGFQGPGANRRTGATARTPTGRVRKVRAFKPRRWNGVTQPKHTIDHAVRAMERAVPRVTDRAVRKVIAKRFDVTR
jgi:hypothetical protein